MVSRKIENLKRGTAKLGFAVIHGIHSVSGQVLGLPDGVSHAYSTPDLYPAGVSWIVELLEEANCLRARLDKIRKALHPYKIDSSRGYRIGKDADAYENALRELEAEHAKATKNAKELNDQPRVVYKAPV